jgi:putative transposase
MMTQFNFTLDMDKLKQEISQSNLSEVMKSALTLVLNTYMENQRDSFIQASSYERNDNRSDYRNGYYERDLIVSIGNLCLKVPRTRSGNFTTDAFEKYARCDQALLISMLEMVVNGVSTRNVTKVVENLCGKSVSKSMVSNLTKGLDPIVNDWANRPLNVMQFNYIYTDAMYIKVRENDRVVSKAVYIALGVNEENKREVIGLKVDHVESEDGWRDFFESLKSRGLQSPRLVISDAHAGLKAAISKAFVGTSWQRCTVHMLRNMIQTMPRKNSKEARTLLKSIFRAPNLSEARRLKNQFFSTYEDQKGYQKAISILDEGFDDATQFYSQPESYHVSLRTTNVLERLNSEIRRRERVIRIFPNQQSAFRLIGAVLMDYEGKLDLGGRKFLND